MCAVLNKRRCKPWTVGQTYTYVYTVHSCVYNIDVQMPRDNYIVDSKYYYVCLEDPKEKKYTYTYMYILQVMYNNCTLYALRMAIQSLCEFSAQFILDLGVWCSVLYTCISVI